LTNLQEYYAGTDPTNAASVLKVLSVLPPATGATNVPVTFLAVSNHTYTVEFKTALDAAPWSPLQTIPAAATNRLLQLQMPATGNSGFLRLRTP
jgi:hypothetical protein